MVAGGILKVDSQLPDLDDQVLFYLPVRRRGLSGRSSANQEQRPESHYWMAH
jgi:hypothetical protein